METALFTVSFLLHFHSSALNISHGILRVFFPLLGFLAHLFSRDHVVFFFSIFSFPSRSLLVSSLHILMLSQSAVSTAPVGAVLRVIFSGCERECVCVNGFDLLSTTGPHFPCAARRPAAGPGLRRAHEETTSSMFFPQSLQTNERAGSLSTRMQKLSPHTGNHAP